jgi:hypothetical protein
LSNRSGSSGHFSSFQAFIVAEQTTGSIAAPSHQRLGVFPRLSDFNDILQLCFTNLGSGELQLSATTDRLGFLQLLNLGLPSRNEFGLVGCFVLSFPLPLSSLRFFIILLALVLQTTETLTYRSGGDASLLVGGIVETGSGLLLKGNVCVVLCGWQVRKL